MKKFIENGKNKNNQKHNEEEKDNKLIMPIIPKINNINRFTPKSRTIIATQSSRFLIKKINSSNLRNRDNNISITNMKKKHDNFMNSNDNNDKISDLLLRSDIYKDLPGINDNKIFGHKNECNHFKYDRHYGNENNCPICQSMDIKINYLKEKKNIVMPNINSHVANNSFNQNLEDYKRDNIILPFKYFGKLYLKNYNNYRNNTNNLNKLQRNKSVIQIKKINIMKYSEQLLKNYKSSLMAIKDYFDIK